MLLEEAGVDFYLAGLSLLMGLSRVCDWKLAAG